MLSERRWSEGSALKFLKAKANQFSGPSNSSSGVLFSSASSSTSTSVSLSAASHEDVTDEGVSEPLGFPAGELGIGGQSNSGDGFIRRFWRKKKSLTINEYDPSFKVIYLGNVLTGWAKGDGCVDRPLATLWKNYKAQNGKQEIQMKMTVTNSGLKAFTKEHGLTEYWSNRVTFCNTHPRYPKVFCWVYRHEGRRLKQELRCHAVLCPNEAKATKLAQALQQRLHFALQEFRRDKLNRQKARLSLANCVYDVPSLPRRKQLLSTGMHNYRPPLERSKSAPKLKSIEEGFEESALEDLIEEDEEQEIEQESSTSPPASSSINKSKSVGSKMKIPSSLNDDEEEEEDEISFAYNLDSSCQKCVRGLDRCSKIDCRCRCGETLLGGGGAGYGDLTGQLLDVDGIEDEEEDEETVTNAVTRLLPRSSLPGQILPGPVRTGPSPEPSRSSFSLGSPICPGRTPACMAGLCDEKFCRARAPAISGLLPPDSDLALLRLDSGINDDEDDVGEDEEDVVESNNNLVRKKGVGSRHQTNKGCDKGEDSTSEESGYVEGKDIVKAVKIAGFVGCFRQSKA